MQRDFLKQIFKRKTHPLTRRMCLYFTKVGVSFCIVNQLDGLAIEHIGVVSETELPDIFEKFQLKNVPCSWLLSPRDYRFLLTNAPSVPKEEQIEAAKWLVKDLIHFPVEDALVDGFVVPTAAATSASEKLYLSVAQLSIIQPTVERLLSYGFHLITIDVIELALCNLLEKNLYRKDGYGILYFYEGESLLLLCRDEDIFFIRRLRLNESMIRNFSSASELDYSLSDFSVEIQRSLDYFETELKQGSIKTVVCIPNHSVDSDSRRIDKMHKNKDLQTDKNIFFVDLGLYW